MRDLYGYWNCVLVREVLGTVLNDFGRTELDTTETGGKLC